MKESAQYISLGALAQQLDIYEDMPVRLHPGMQDSIRLTLKTNVIAIPVAFFLPKILWWMLPFFDILEITGGAAFGLLAIINALSIPLIILNLVSLLIILVILAISDNMTQPVPQNMHRLAWGAAFPSGITLLSGAVFGALLALLFVVTIVIWIVLIIVVCAAIGVVLAGLAAG